MIGPPPTNHAPPIDNICTDGIINGTMKKLRSKAIGMSFYWLNYCECQRKFHIHWRRGTDNLANYFTKHHSPTHNRLMHSKYILYLHRTNSELEFPWKHPSHVFNEGVLICASSPPPGSSLTTTCYLYPLQVLLFCLRVTLN